MLRKYEVTVILKPNLEEVDERALVERILEMFKEGEGGVDPSIDDWGIRRLAYPIENIEEGRYLFIKTDLETTHIAELERNLSFETDILRSMAVRENS